MFSHIASFEVGFGKDIGSTSQHFSPSSYPESLSSGTFNSFSFLNHDHAASLSCLEAIFFCITDLKQGRLSL